MQLQPPYHHQVRGGARRCAMATVYLLLPFPLECIHSWEVSEWVSEITLDTTTPHKINPFKVWFFLLFLQVWDCTETVSLEVIKFLCLLGMINPLKSLRVVKRFIWMNRMLSRFLTLPRDWSLLTQLLIILLHISGKPLSFFIWPCCFLPHVMSHFNIIGLERLPLFSFFIFVFLERLPLF